MDKDHPEAVKQANISKSSKKGSQEAIALPTDWMKEQTPLRAKHPPLDPNQITSLVAMIVFVAHKSGQSEYRIERTLSDHFKVANPKFLAAGDFDAAIHYLSNLCPN